MKKWLQLERQALKFMSRGTKYQMQTTECKPLVFRLTKIMVKNWQPRNLARICCFKWAWFEI